MRATSEDTCGSGGADNAQPTAAMLNDLCYQYRYDERNRLNQKKLPGKGWEYMVYNQADQPVLTQDANQRLTNQWTATKYDAQGRVIMTGLWNAGSTILLSALQGSIYAAAQWDTRNTSDTNTGYTFSSYPAVSSYLSINYYDDYSFGNITDLPTAFTTAPAGATTQVSGLPTGTKINILGTTNMLWAVNYYDGLNRIIQTYKQHNQGGGTLNSANYDMLYNTYDFTNAVTASTRKHYNTTSTTPLLTIVNGYTYDHMGRKLTSLKQINGGINIMLSKNDYNEIGQLTIKHLHSENSGSSFLQNVGYTYNERGWLRTAGNSNNLFSYELRYNNSTDAISKQYNGNVAEMLYNGTVSGSKTFIYGYDPLNRLTNATSTNNALDEQLSYDVQGNIISLVRSGSSSANLSYIYQSNNLSNQLQTVTNGGSAFRTYSYDQNGNATSDGGSKTILYNLLNLPKEIDQSGAAIATYTYDVTGSKLRSTGNNGAWDYVDGIVYQNNAVAFISTEEGRAVPNGGAYRYEYNLKDQLGNVRLSFDKDPSTGVARRIQEDEYYSFGLRKIGGFDLSNNNRYLYNGKEIQTDLANQYDYGARFYDPVIGRWGAIDPLAETTTIMSPYNYGNDNPMTFFDPDGMSTESWMREHGVTNDNLITLWEAPAQQEDGGDDCCKTAPTVQPTTGTPVKSPMSKSVVNEAGELILEDGVKIPGVAEIIGYYIIKLFTSGNDAKNPETVYNEYGGPKGNTDTTPGFDDEMERQGHFRGQVPNNNEERKEYYIHYSNRKGIVGIAMSHVILPNKKNKVYLTKAFLTEKEVENILFIGDPTKKGFGKYVTIFKVDPDQASNITKNPTHVYEYDYNAGSLRIRTGNMVYIGINPKVR